MICFFKALVNVMMKSVSLLLKEVRNCNICTNHLPYYPPTCTSVTHPCSYSYCGAGPGRKVHESSVPFADMSGTRLRQWLGVSSEGFYEPHTIAILPMGLCFPGTGNAGDLPPRPECAPAWRELWPDLVPMLHPGLRNKLWFRINPWFETELLPLPRTTVKEIPEEKAVASTLPN